MKCLNMRITEVLFFILNFVTIYQMDTKENKTSEMATIINIALSNVAKDCPQLSKMIHDDNLTDYKISCSPFKINNEVNVENVLQQACFVISDMLDFMCDKKLNETADLFKADDLSSICPFNFSHLEHLSFKHTNFKLLNELKNKDHCLMICSDLYSKRAVCVLLSKLNYLMGSFTQPSIPEDTILLKVDKPPVKLEQTKITAEKTKGIIIEQKPETSSNKSVGETLNATELMKVKKKENNLMMTSVAEEVEQKTNYNIETSKSNADIQEDNKLISESENLNEKKLVNFENQEDITSLGDPFLDKAEVSPNLSKMESSDIKLDLSTKQKEIYSGEGFFSAEDSHFYFYLIMVSSIVVIGYIAFHNKNKILAYALEGTSGRRSRRRPNPARYRKLETNLEEVISSNATNATASSIVY